MIAAVGTTERAGVWAFAFTDDGEVSATWFLLIDWASKFYFQANDGHGFFSSSIWRQRMPYRRSKSFNTRLNMRTGSFISALPHVVDQQPASKHRLDDLLVGGAARAVVLDELVEFLARGALGADQRVAVDVDGLGLGHDRFHEKSAGICAGAVDVTQPQPQRRERDRRQSASPPRPARAGRTAPSPSAAWT